MSEKDIQIIKIPKSHEVYANIVHWVTIISTILALVTPVLVLMFPEQNSLNPNVIFDAIFNGATTDEIWAMSQTGAFLGGHSYLTHPGLMDSWALFAINFGCAVGLFATIPAVIIQVFKEKDYFYAILGVIFIILVFLPMVGIITVQS